LTPLVTDALVLRTYDFGETSRIVVFLSRAHGKLRAVAKGARTPRSRYRSALEPLSEVRAALHGREGAELHGLGQCELLRSAVPVAAKGLEAALVLGYLAELLDAFCVEGDQEDKSYRLAVAVLRALEEGGDPLVLARYAEAWLLRLHGVYPQIDRCATCNLPLGPGELRYHAPARGFVGEECGPGSGPSLSAGVRSALNEAFSRPPSGLAQGAALRSLESFHQDLIGYHLERSLRSYRVLRDALRETRG
jgi:DNA repair protein RecO (recombination protein O)